MTKKRQIDFEEQSHKEAIQKLRKQLNKAKSKAYFSSTDGARETIKTQTLELSKELEHWIEGVCSGRATTRADAAMMPELKQWMEFIHPEFITVILLKSIFDTHGNGFDDPTVSKVGSFIGRRLEDEIRFKFYEITAPPEVVDAAWRRVTETGSTPHYRRLSTKIITEKMLDELQPDGEKWRTWTSGYRTTMGLNLLEFATRAGIVIKENKRVGKKTKGYVSLTPAYIQFFNDFCDQMEDIAYFRKPLIEKPLPWIHQDGPSIKNVSGGYHTDKLRNQLPMCRGYAHQSEFGELSTKFLTTLGETAYTVDTNILEVAQHLKDKALCVKTFNPYVKMSQLEDKMPNHLTELPSEHPDRKAWRIERRDLWNIHNELVRKSVRSIKSLKAANAFLKHPRFYLSWSYDYRGRAYPQQPWLQPQSTEFEKSLIRFADGCKLDERAKWWVAQAVAAAYIGTNENLEDRVQWCYDNWELISKVGANPIETIHLWEAAKEPFQFLQLAIEYYKVVITKTQHLWFVPIGVDATCSGLQLLSGCLRDEKGMKHSNVLTPSNPDDKPEDAYILVLDKAKELAQVKDKDLIPYLVHRALGKTTMVMLYGATTYTVKQKVKAVFQDLNQYGKNKEVTSEMCQRMAQLLQKASSDVFPAAFEALTWLKKLAKHSSKTKPPSFSWVTPSGDLIKYRNYKVETLDIRLPHLGKVRIPLDSSNELDYKEMINALCPSYIHSLDASLLKIAFNEWNRPITSIHDCFKCLPSEMDRAQDAIRKAFYSVCDGNPLKLLAEGLQVTTDTLDNLPQGKGDLKSVFGSTFLFN